MPEPVRRLFTIQDENAFKYVQCKNGYIQFTVRAWNTGLHIGLFTVDDSSEDSNTTNPKYVINVALEPHIDSKVTLQKESDAENLQSVSVPHILYHKEWKGFWIHVSKGTIAFGKENESEPIISWKEPKFTPLTKIGFRTLPYLYFHEDLEGRAGEADIVVDSSPKSQPSGVHWVKCSHGQIPENAVVGGHDNGNTVYVIRAMIRHALTPGKLRSGREYSEVSWNCREHPINEYEILADFNGDWVKTREDKIPPFALLAGRSEDNFPLYVGRTSHEGTMTVGKVQPNHKALYIPFRGQEIGFKEYEILCHKPPGLPVIPHPSLETFKEQPELKWVYSCNGRVPRNAFVIGSHQDQAVILIRTKHHDTWYPGWMCCADGADGHVIHMNVEEYDVLCDFNGYWDNSTTDLIVPENAVVIDKDDQENEIYVGRSWHRGRLLCGPIINMTCDIFYEDEHFQKEEFEVLCYPNHVESVTKNGLNNSKHWDV